jgi:hypothetical protein
LPKTRFAGREATAARFGAVIDIAPVGFFTRDPESMSASNRPDPEGR